MGFYGEKKEVLPKIVWFIKDHTIEIFCFSLFPAVILFRPLSVYPAIIPVWIYPCQIRYNYLSYTLSIYLSNYLFICLPSNYSSMDIPLPDQVQLSIYLSYYLSINIPISYLSIYLPLSVYPATIPAWTYPCQIRYNYLSYYLSINIPISYLSIYLSICLPSNYSRTDIPLPDQV